MTRALRRSTLQPVARIQPLLREYGDLLLAIAVTGVGAIETISDGDISTGQKLANLVTLLALAALLTIRQRVPLVLLGLGLVGAAVEPLRGETGHGEVFGLIMLLTVYTAAAHTNGLRMWLAAALTMATGILVLVNDPDSVGFGSFLFFGLLFGTPWLVGRAIRQRRMREARLEREKAEAEAAIADERARIARELHDVVAHAISVIVLQARGGRKLLDEEPDETRRALDEIERTSSQALGEMRRLLGLLRETNDELALAPHPTLARLDDLVTRVRDAGLPVELAVEGEPTELSPGVDLSAYRIVQEALTNALKHAGPATARVTVRYDDSGLELEISDTGVGGANGGGTGQGLAGIRERVAVFGGDVEAGEQPEGGYLVRARLPYVSER
jgi:signal transduction histidine kinase